MSENESVTNVTNVTMIFRPRHALREIWDGGGFCRYHCSVLRLDNVMGILSFDYARCAWDWDGLHLLQWSCTSKTQKNTEAGWKLRAFCNKRKVPLTIPRPSRSEHKKHGTIIYFRWAYHALYSFRQSYFLSKSPSNVLISANGSA